MGRPKSDNMVNFHTLVVGAMGITVYPQEDGRLSALSDDHVASYTYQELGAEYYSVRFDQELNRWRIDLYDEQRNLIPRPLTPPLTSV